MAQLNYDDDTYCYTDKNINTLLLDLSKGDYIVSEAANDKHDCCQKIIDNACKQLRNCRKMIPAVVIPVNINSNEDGSFYGSHWIGLVVLLDDKGALKAFFIDSLCSCTKSIITIHKCLFENGVESILSYKKQQNNLCDSGPWTVFNLDSLARTGELAKNVDQESISNQRAHLKSILRVVGVKTRFSEKSKMPIREIKETNHEKNRSRDVMKLEEMLGEINLCEEKKSDLRTMWCRIGYLSGEISREDKRDPKCNDIRNTHGYIKRNSANNVINIKGIHFEKLLQLKILLENENLYGVISPDDLQVMEQSVFAIKQQILRVLQQEKYYISHPDTKLENQLLHVLVEHEPVASSISIGRFLEIIGVYYDKLLLSQIKQELLVLDDIDFNIQSDRYVIARVFTNLGDLANELVEDRTIQDNGVFVFFKNLYTVRSKIIHCHKKIKLEQDNEVKKTFLKVKDCLDKCIVSTGSGDWGLDMQHELDSGAMKSLLQYVKKGLKTAESESVLRDKFLKKEADTEQIRYILDKLVFQASKFIRGITPVRRENQLADRLERLNRDYMKAMETLDEADLRCRYPPFLNLTNQTLIIQHSQRNIPIKPYAVNEFEKKKIDIDRRLIVSKIKCKLVDIDEEIEYLSSIVSDRTLPEVRKSHVIEHIVLITSQYVRDLGDINCNTHTHEMSYQTSVIHKVLANGNLTNHIRLVFGGVCKLLQRSSIDGLVEYLYGTGDHRIDPIVAMTRCNIGVSLAIVGYYEHAVEYLEKASRDIKCHKRRSGVDDNGDYLHAVCGIDQYRLHIDRTLANVLAVSGHHDKAIAIFKRLINKIMTICDLVIVDKGGSDMRREICNVLIDYYMCVRGSGDSCQLGQEETIVVCQQAARMLPGVTTNVNLTEMYYKSGQFELANKSFNNTMQMCRDDQVKQLATLDAFVMVYLTSGDLDRGVQDAKLCVDKMDTILRQSTDLFVDIFHGRSLLAKLKIIYVKLISKPERNCISEELENEVELLIGGLKDNYKRDPTISLIQMVFCWIFSMELTLSGLEKAEKYFKLAVESVDRLPKQLAIVTAKLQETADVLASVLIRYSWEHRDQITEIDMVTNLNVCMNLQKTHNISGIGTNYHLSVYYLDLAKRYLSLDDKQQATHHLLDTIKYARHQLLEHTYQDDLTKSNDRNCGVIEIQLESICNLAFCYHTLADLQFDTTHVKHAISYYDLLLNMSVAVDKTIEFVKYKEQCQKKFRKYSNFLQCLLNFDGHLGLVDFDVGMVEFCSRKFKMELRFQHGMVFWDNKNLEGIKKIEEELKEITENIDVSD